MKVRAYIRIARDSAGHPQIAALSRHCTEPLKDSRGEALPTVAFAVEFIVPDEAFRRSAQLSRSKLIASVDVQSPEPLATVRQIEEDRKDGWVRVNTRDEGTVGRIADTLTDYVGLTAPEDDWDVRVARAVLDALPQEEPG